MEKEETREGQRRSSAQRKLHLNSSRRSHKFHEKEIQKPSSLDQRRGTDSSGKRGSQLDREKTVSGLTTGDWPLVRSDDATYGQTAEQAIAIKAMEAWPGSATWPEKQRSSSIPRPLASPPSPRTIRLRAKDGRLARGFSGQSSHIKSTTQGPDSPSDRPCADRGNSSQITHDPKHDSKLQRSTSLQIESTPSKNSQKPRLASVTGRIERTTRPADDNDSPKPNPKDRDSDPDSRLQALNPRDTLPADDGVINKSFGPRDSSNKQRSDHTLLPETPEHDHKVDESINSEEETVSDTYKNNDETETSETTSHNNERDGLESQSQPSESEPTLINASFVRDTAEQQSNSETNETKEKSGIIHSPGTLESKSHDSQSKSPQSEYISDLAAQDQHISPDTAHSSGAMESKGPNSQRKLPGGDNAKSPEPETRSSRNEHVKDSEPQPESPENHNLKNPDSTSQSAEPTGIADETTSTQDQAGKDTNAEAWFDRNAPLPGNYKAFLRGTPIPESHSPKRERNSIDSLVISPTRTGDYWEHEEDWAGIVRENAKNMRILDEYRAKIQLKPTFDEEGKRRAAKAAEKAARSSRRRNPSLDMLSLDSMSTLSSDGSLILSPGQYDEDSHTDSEPEQDPFRKVEEEGQNQAALHRIELYRINYELQRTIEAKEAKFKRDIQIAWAHPRPPPTTHEEHLDRIALKEIESKEIFDEFGEQQRPIRTDPRLVTRETQINMMIKNARIQHLLGDYRQMYNHANHAAVAASELDFAPFTARCYFYRGLAMYLNRNFNLAKDDFLNARGCASLYGISMESIERYIHLIDSAEDEETAILETFPPREVNSSPKAGRTGGTWRRNTNRDDVSPPPRADDAVTLGGESPRSSVHGDSALSPLGSPSREEQSSRQASEDDNSQFQTPRWPIHIGGLPPDHDPQPAINDLPNYQPQDKAVSELLREDIQESKAPILSNDVLNYQPQDTALSEVIHKAVQMSKAPSLSTVSEAVPAEANLQAGETVPPSSMASTGWTLLGTNTTMGTERLVSRPHVAPITTSLASPQATPGAGYKDESDSNLMDPEEIYTHFGGRPREGREDATSDSDSDSDSAK